MIGKKSFIVNIVWLVLATAQDPNCDFRQNVSPGTTYYLHNQGYPGSYAVGSRCRWVAVCPVGYNCKLFCSEINLPDSPQCSGDRLLLSKSGDPTLTGADKYCGKGSLSALSTGNTLSLGLISTQNSPGGRFLCQLTAQVAPTPPTPTCTCGYKNANRIVGGTETEVSEYPMMAALVDRTRGSVTCGAAIIAPHYLVTAAHCFASKQSASNLEVVVGAHDINNVDSPATRSYAVKDYLVHPRFDINKGFDYDIGLIQTAQDIQFGPAVGPACLPFKYYGNSFAGENVTLLGWGTTFPGGPVSDTLLKAQVQVLSQAQCRAQLDDITDRMLCHYTPGKDACQHDSGGPVLYTEPASGRLYSVGAVSHGRLCGAEPGVNTRLTELLGWLLESTPDAQYCRA